MKTRLEPYDVAAYEQFCSDLVQADFSPKPGTDGRRWTGPTRPKLKALTGRGRMEVAFLDGWPYRYAHVTVPEFSAEHVASTGTLCLWAEDDPAQLAGASLPALWQRLDDWTETARTGFGIADRALDAWAIFAADGDGAAERFVELDIPDLVGSGGNGQLAPVFGRTQGRALRLQKDPTACPLQGSFYVRHRVPRPPHTLDEFRDLLTNKQRRNLDRGLSKRRDVAQNQPSGGLDHVVLAWPRHEQFNAQVLSFSGTGATLQVHPNVTSPSDRVSRLRRAGPDATILAGKRVLLAGVGAIGGHVAVTLASSGLTHLELRDDDHLRTVNLVRHVVDEYSVGYSKTAGVAARLAGTAPWCEVVLGEDLSQDPAKLASQVNGHDLVVDCTGIFSMTSALAHACVAVGVPLLVGTLYHQGSLLRIRRQAAGDTPLLQRNGSSAYVTLPPDRLEATAEGFLELGCTAPVHNAPPASVLRAAADVSAAAVDMLTGRLLLADETVTVLSPLSVAPFDRIGPIDLGGGPPAVKVATGGVGS